LTKIGRYFLAVLLLFLVPYSTGAKPEMEPLILGQSCALSGPTQDLGLEVRAGLLAAFSEQNAKGGIKNREIILISKDDGYEPYRAERNSLELIQNDDVFLLIGEVGTPTSQAVLPVIRKYNVPFFAPLTGAEFLRDPFNKYVINVRGSYYQEMEKLAQYLIDQKKLTRIACFYQNDSYGYTGLAGITRALEKRGLNLVSQGSYERNTVAVLGAMNEIDQGEPQAIVLVGAYSACVEFIKLRKNRNKAPCIYGNISFVGSKSLQKSLGSYHKDVIVSQVVPFPWDLSLQLIKNYQLALHNYQSSFSPGFGSLEGYVAGRLFCAIATQIEGEITREKFLETIYRNKTFDIDGLKLVFGDNDNQGMDDIYLTAIAPDFVRID